MKTTKHCLDRSCISFLALLAVGSSTAWAQGPEGYLNFETPLHNALSLATFPAGAHFLLACNAPSNEIDVIDTSTNGIVDRVRVGLEPVSVVVGAFSDGKFRCYSANWLGDSISAFDLFPDGHTTLLRTVRVGDEPTMIAIWPTDGSLIVSFSAASAIGQFDPDTLAPKSSGSDLIYLLNPQSTQAIKDPRTVAFQPGTSSLFVLNSRGGNDDSPPTTGYDWDVWGMTSPTSPLTTGVSNMRSQGGTGSTNFKMAFASNGDLYVVSQNARNKITNFVTEPLGESALQTLVLSSTGFTTSQLIRIRNPCTATPALDKVDLNSTSGYLGTQSSIPITQPTDLAILEDAQAGSTNVFVTGFDSDTLGIATPITGGGWSVQRFDVSLGAAGFSPANTAGLMRGPRALVLDPASLFSGAPPVLYVLYRMTNEIEAYNARSMITSNTLVSLGVVTLADPTPTYIKSNRKFLYSSKLSGGGSVSCASCHIDGHTDGLAWNLSDNTPVPVPPASMLPDTQKLGKNAAVKGPMQTQSLRGLVNFEIENEHHQNRLFTNAPYHWRGDRATFLDFNGAFFNLMGLSVGGSPFLLSNADMGNYRRFANSIHFPPNPNEEPTRTYSGRPPDATPTYDPNDLSQGDGALRGMRRYHIQNSDGGGDTLATVRSCVICHSLPDGSNNRFTDSFNYTDSEVNPPQHVALSTQKIETPQVRSLVTKEAELWRRLPPTGPNLPAQLVQVPVTAAAKVAEFGLNHTGKTTLENPNSGNLSGFSSRSIRAFVGGFLDATFTSSDRDEVALFLRELDTGVAPSIGRVRTVDVPGLATQLTSINADLDLFEGQANVANAEVSVLVRASGVWHGLWYDVSDTTTPYHEDAVSGVTPVGPLSRAGLFALIQSGTQTPIAIVQCVPLGSGRRISYLGTGAPPVLATAAPTTVRLKACKPNTADTFVPSLTVGWFPQLPIGDPVLEAGVNAFRDNATAGVFFGSNKTIAIYQISIALFTGTIPWLSGYHHETSRRFVVTGNGIRQGAKLRISFMTTSQADNATNTTFPNTTSPVLSDPLVFRLFPAKNPAAPGGVEWQTDVELEPIYLLGLMNGGFEGNKPTAQSVDQTLVALQTPQDPTLTAIRGATPLTDLLLPQQRNWYLVEVIENGGNTSAPASTAGWQRILIE